MPELAYTSFDLLPRHAEMLGELLQKHLPHVDVWAYGSRVKGNGHDTSDLDLVIRNPTELTQPSGLNDIVDALSESNLPISVEVLDWAQIPERFRDEIERAYVVVQIAHLNSEM